MNHQLLRARGADLLKANDLSEQSVESRLPEFTHMVHGNQL